MNSSRFEAPLIFAGAEDARIFQLLLDHGADIEQRDSEKRSLTEYLQETLEKAEAFLATGNMSGNLMRRVK